MSTFKKLATDVHLKKWTILTKTDDYTVILDDLEKCIILDSSTDKTFDLPDSSISYKGRRIRCATINSGKIIINPYTDGYINGILNADLESDIPYSFIELILVAANSWNIHSIEGYQEYNLYGGWNLT